MWDSLSKKIINSLREENLSYMHFFITQIPNVVMHVACKLAMHLHSDKRLLTHGIWALYGDLMLLVQFPMQFDRNPVERNVPPNELWAGPLLCWVKICLSVTLFLPLNLSGKTESKSTACLYFSLLISKFPYFISIYIRNLMASE